MSLTLTSCLPERDQRALERILEGFDKLLSRADAQYSRLRKHNRRAFHGSISFCAAEPNAVPPEDHRGLPIGWTYSLSQGGIGLVSLEDVPSNRVFIGLHLPGGNIRWMPGRVVRRREIPEERFIEYGVAFGTEQKPSSP